MSNIAQVKMFNITNRCFVDSRALPASSFLFSPKLQHAFTSCHNYLQALLLSHSCHDDSKTEAPSPVARCPDFQKVAHVPIACTLREVLAGPALLPERDQCNRKKHWWTDPSKSILPKLIALCECKCMPWNPGKICFAEMCCKKKET